MKLLLNLTKTIFVISVYVTLFIVGLWIETTSFTLALLASALGTQIVLIGWILTIIDSESFKKYAQDRVDAAERIISIRRKLASRLLEQYDKTFHDIIEELNKEDK